MDLRAENPDLLNVLSAENPEISNVLSFQPRVGWEAVFTRGSDCLISAF